MTIGERAAIAVKEAAEKNGTTITEECEKLGTTRKTVSVWNNGKTEPCAYLLQQMLFRGYDVIYILKGE